MGGIVGFTLPAGLGGEAASEAEAKLRLMLAALRHRGPGGLRGRRLDKIALGHAGRQGAPEQPLRDPATGVTVVAAGEIFLPRPRPGASRQGAAATLLAAYLREGIGCLEALDGQLAFALYDPRDATLWLGRDRFGICPLVFAQARGAVLFASEAKALFAAGLEARLDPRALAQTFHLWAPAEGRTAFEGVRALPAGCVARVRDGVVTTRRYWDLDLTDERVDRRRSFAEAAEELEAVLDDAIAARQEGVGEAAAYLSGGLDSSLVCALAQRRHGGGLRTYAAAFEHGAYDEAGHQRAVAAALGTAHHALLVENQHIGAALAEVVEHAEVPLLRTAPAPLLLLAREAREQGARVVLTGEGADELFWGYDLFRETAIRSFWARRPGSDARPALFRRLYPYLAVSRQSPELLRRFFGVGLEAPDAVDFSHRIRWSNSGRVARFLSPAWREQLRGWDPLAEVLEALPAGAERWRPLARAQALEVRTLLSTYLLGSQGERMLAAGGVQGRFPFLDRRVAELAATLPPSFKLQGLREKRILRRVARGKVPAQVETRQKFPYRAPVAAALIGAGAPAWVEELLSRRAVEEVGIFDGAKVEGLLAKLRARGQGSDADDMALAAVATTQLLAARFARRWEVPRAALDRVEVAA